METEYFKLTKLENGDIGIDVKGMDNQALMRAYEAFNNNEDGDDERQIYDNEQLNRIIAEMTKRNILGGLK